MSEEFFSPLYRGKHIWMVERLGWEFAHRPGLTGIVAIVPITPEGKLVLVEQYRIPVGAPVLELPAGLVGDDEPGGESLEDAARRELLEETGYEASRWTLLTEGPPSPGLGDEVVTFFLAEGLNKISGGGGIDDEDITVHEVPLGEVHDWLEERRRAGTLADPKIYIGLYFAGTRGWK